MCGSKKSRFKQKANRKAKEAKWLLSNLGLRTPLSKVFILGDFLLWIQLDWSTTLLEV